MRLISVNNPKSPISEAYRILRTNIEFSNLDVDIKTILVTSSQQNEGKSTAICNLAASFAMLEGKRVIIIDCDLRNPTVHRMFNKSNVNGITDVLKGTKTLMECLNSTPVDNLQILTAGKLPPNPSEVLASKKMKVLIEELKEHYDYVFIDAPPIGIITDAGILANFVDGTILLAASNEVDREKILISKERLEKVNANILGVILNKFKEEGSAYGYYNYAYEQEDTSRGGRKKKRKKKFGLTSKA